MNTFDKIISRNLLASVRQELKAQFPEVNMRDAWTYQYKGLGQGDTWEFQYKGFMWQGQACGAYEARYEGWSAWMAHKGREQARADEANGCIQTVGSRGKVSSQWESAYEAELTRIFEERGRKR